ncbi:MAG: transketolase [Planctomycetota bacterium]|jgi:transketolase
METTTTNWPELCTDGVPLPDSMDRAELTRLLARYSAKLRARALQMIKDGGSGHPGGSFSAMDIMVSIYFATMRARPGDPEWTERDRFVLSKGHACPALYVILAELGYYDQNELNGFRAIGRMLQGHPSTATPGVECVSGSLGQGFSAALGMAVGLERAGRSEPRVFCITGDGELQEGQCWEVIMAAGHRKQSNFTVFVDANGLQGDTRIEETLNLEPLPDKWRAFGWAVREIDGHDFDAILDAIDWAKTVRDAPQVVIARTIKGKGVSYMEDVQKWHGTAPPDDEEMSIALAELNAQEEANS